MQARAELEAAHRFLRYEEGFGRPREAQVWESPGQLLHASTGVCRLEDVSRRTVSLNI